MAHNVSFYGLPIDPQNDLAYIGESAAMQRELSSQSTGSDHLDYLMSCSTNMPVLSEPQVFWDDNLAACSDAASRAQSNIKPHLSVPAIVWSPDEYVQVKSDPETSPFACKFDLDRPPFSFAPTVSPTLNSWAENPGAVDLSRSGSMTSYMTGNSSEFSAEMARIYSNSSFSSGFEDDMSNMSPRSNADSPCGQLHINTSMPKAHIALPTHTSNPTRGHRASISSQYSTSPQSELLSPHVHSIQRSLSNHSHTSTSFPKKTTPRRRTKPQEPPTTLLSKPHETIEPTNDADMVRIRSSDGSSRQVGVLPRRPQAPDALLPAAPKLRCVHCNRSPDGFRGEHELQRHSNLYHQERRKAWICVNRSADRLFLAGCKACVEGKVYGAYYNAAAHLRRVHFDPRPRGAKAKSGAPSRAGKAGGNKPAMETLKKHWMKEVEVVNDAPVGAARVSKATDAEQPDEALDGTEAAGGAVAPALASQQFESLMALDAAAYPAATPLAWSLQEGWARRQAELLGQVGRGGAYAGEEDEDMQCGFDAFS